MNTKQKQRRVSNAQKRRLTLRKELWGDVSEDRLWNRNVNDGYTTIPRTFPIIAQAMDYLAGKGKPVSNAYFALWCRVFDESIIEVDSAQQLALESGFSGQRAVTTWNSRIAKLVELGFIEAEQGRLKEYKYILIYNPYKVIKDLYERGDIPKPLYMDLLDRAQSIGAKDLSR